MCSTCGAQCELAQGAKTLRRTLCETPQARPPPSNLGGNWIQRRKTNTCISEIREGIKGNPGHASSWRALGVAYQNVGQRARAFVAYARFLTLEPDTERSRAVSPQLWALPFEGVTREPKEGGSTGTNITIPKLEKKDDVSVTSQPLMMSVVAASRYLDEWKDEGDAQFFANAFDKVRAILGELGANAKRSDPFWTATAPYLTGARQAGHLEEMAYEIRRSLGDPETLKWLGDHADEVDSYREWSKGWKPVAE